MRSLSLTQYTLPTLYNRHRDKMVRLLAVLALAGAACVSAFVPMLPPSTGVQHQQGECLRRQAARKMRRQGWEQGGGLDEKSSAQAVGRRKGNGGGAGVA